MRKRELELALTKTKIVLHTKKRIPRLFPVHVGEGVLPELKLQSDAYG